MKKEVSNSVISTQYKTGSIREILHRLNAEGYHVTEHALRVFVKQGIIPSTFVGKKAYINFDRVVEVLEGKVPSSKAV